MDDDQYRAIVARQFAHDFLLEWLLKQSFAAMPKPVRLAVAESLLDATEQTDAFAGLAKGNEFLAEWLSDVLIRFQQEVDRKIGQVLLGVDEDRDG